MCLGVPGRVTHWIDRDPLTALAEIDFGGIRRNCQMACVTEAEVGEYVLVHAGIGLAIIDAAAAEDLLRTLNSMGDLSVEAGESP